MELLTPGQESDAARKEKKAATDFADRAEHQIVPPLKAGSVVLADRYIYTAFARDVARGVSREWVRGLYGFAVKPTVGFYFRVALDEAIRRLRTGRAGFKFYEAGADLGLADDLEESFRLFQSRIIEEYERMVEEFGLVVSDARLPIEAQQNRMRKSSPTPWSDRRKRGTADGPT